MKVIHVSATRLQAPRQAWLRSRPREPQWPQPRPLRAPPPQRPQWWRPQPRGRPPPCSQQARPLGKEAGHFNKKL